MFEATNDYIFTNSSSKATLVGSIITGYNHEITMPSNNGNNVINVLGSQNLVDLSTDTSLTSKSLLMCGCCGTISSSNITDMFIVGAGASTSARANCFAAGKDASSNMYIKIGSTTLTETQLQALLAQL